MAPFRTSTNLENLSRVQTSEVSRRPSSIESESNPERCFSSMPPECKEGPADIRLWQGNHPYAPIFDCACIYVVLIQGKPPEKKKTKPKWGFFQGKPPGKAKKKEKWILSRETTRKKTKTGTPAGFPRKKRKTTGPPCPSPAPSRPQRGEAAGPFSRRIQSQDPGTAWQDEAEALCGAPSWDKSDLGWICRNSGGLSIRLSDWKRLLALFCSACGFNLGSV